MRSVLRAAVSSSSQTVWSSPIFFTEIKRRTISELTGKGVNEFRPESFGIRFALEPNHDIVRVTQHGDLALRSLSTPYMNP
ncbi:MAG: hypothetical protein RB191_22635 [Terriglobia bacterium]|nr:hypothetical protein [Terriglobia bacterium]